MMYRSFRCIIHSFPFFFSFSCFLSFWVYFQSNCRQRTVHQHHQFQYATKILLRTPRWPDDFALPGCIPAECHLKLKRCQRPLVRRWALAESRTRALHILRKTAALLVILWAFQFFHLLFHNQNQFHGAQKGLLTEVRIVNGARQDPVSVARHTDCAEIQNAASYGFRFVLTSQADSPFRNYCSVSLCWTKSIFCSSRLCPGHVSLPWCYHISRKDNIWIHYSVHCKKHKMAGEVFSFYRPVSRV